MSLTPLKNLLHDSVAKFGIADQVEASLVLEKFTDVVRELFGEENTKQVKPMYVKNQTLTIASISSVFAQELKLNEKKILDAINRQFQKTIVTRLRYLV